MTSFKHKFRSSAIAGTAFLLFFVYVLYQMFHGFYVNILLGVVLAIALRPVHTKITKHLFGKKKLAALATILLTVLLILLPLFFLLQSLANQAIRVGGNTKLEGLDQTLDKAIVQINNIYEEKTGKKDLVKKDDVIKFVQNKATLLGAAILGILTNFFSLIAGSIILMMTIYYALVEWEGMREYINKYSPLSPVATKKLSTRALAVVRAALKGNLVMIFVQAVAGGVGLAIFGVKPALLLGALYGLASLVPTIGTGTVWIPSVAYLVITGNYPAAIGLAIWNMAVVGSLDNFIMPALVKKGARLHPFFILIGVLGGLSLFGLVGFIIGPTIIALTLVSIELLKEGGDNEVEVNV